MSAPVENQNAVSHGIFSSQIVLPGVERQVDWDRHLEGVRADLRPEGYLEEHLIERIAQLYWRLSRVARFETQSLARRTREAREYEDRDPALLPEFHALRAVVRYESDLGRQLHTAMQELHQLQAQRRAQQKVQNESAASSGEPVTRERQASPVPLRVDQEPPKPSRTPILLSRAALEASGHLLGGRQQAPLPKRLQPCALRREPSRLTTGTDTGTHRLLSRQLCDTK
jgi:hypothetical protein